MAVGKKDYKDSEVRLKHKQKVPPQTLVKVEPSSDDTRTRAELLDAIEDLFQTVYTSTGASREVDLEDLRAILTMLVLSATNADDDGVGATQTQVDAINLNSTNIARNASDLATFISNISISNDKVGIGTTSPVAKLHIMPSTTIGWSSLGAAGILIGTNTGAGIGIDQNEIASKGDHLYLGTIDANKDLILRTGGATNRLVVKGDTGNVGIGTSSPGELLEIYKDGGDVALKIHEDAGTHEAKLHLRRVGSDWELINNNDLAIESEGTELFRIKTSGNVGIGTTSPGEKLEVDGNVKLSGNLNVGGYIHPNDENGNLSIYGGNNTTNDAHILLHGDSNYWGSLELNYGYDATNSFLKISQGSNEHLRITNGGKVGIGTSSPSRSLHIKKSGDNEVARFESDQTSSYIELEDANTTGQILIGTQGDNFKIHTAGTERMRIDSSGNVGIGTTSPSEKLEVDGNVTISGYYYADTHFQSTDSNATLSAIGGGGVYLRPNGAFSTTGQFIVHHTTGNVDISGNLTINSTYPRIFLTDSNHNDDWSIINNDGKFGVYNNTDTSYALSIDGSNNVGIGTSSPSAKLEVSSGSSYSSDFNISIGNHVSVILKPNFTGTIFTESCPIGKFRIGNKLVPSFAMYLEVHDFFAILYHNSLIGKVVYSDG